MNNTYNLDRNSASKLLKVSLRTIDRYMSSGKLTHIKSKGRVWLSREEILNIAKEYDNADKELIELSETTLPDENQVFSDTKSKLFNSDFFRQEAKTDKTDMSTSYQSLEIELKNLKEKLDQKNEELRNTKSKLEQAQYFIAQLEAKMSSMVPLIDYQRQQEIAHKYAIKLKTQTSDLLQKIEEKESQIKAANKEIETERFNKAVFASILFFILILQPILWILLK